MSPAAGAYLVLGATGLVGRAAAAALRALAPTATLYLASRSGARLPDIEGVACAIDVADCGRLVRDIVERHGRIDGVIFAAGTLSPQLFAAVTEATEGQDSYARVKRDGVAALAAALRDVPCGFAIVCGSLAAWLGGIGYGAYAGINLAAASLARTAARRDRTAWMTLALDAIAGTGTKRTGLAEISHSRLVDVFQQVIASAPSLDGAELLIAVDDAAARYRRFVAMIGAGEQPAIAQAEEYPDSDRPCRRCNCSRDCVAMPAPDCRWQRSSKHRPWVLCAPISLLRRPRNAVSHR
jgi:hypothetical protein